MASGGKCCLRLLASLVGFLQLCMLFNAVSCLAAIIGLVMQSFYWNFVESKRRVDFTMIVAVSGEFMRLQITNFFLQILSVDCFSLCDKYSWNVSSRLGLDINDWLGPTMPFTFCLCPSPSVSHLHALRSQCICKRHFSATIIWQREIPILYEPQISETIQLYFRQLRISSVVVFKYVRWRHSHICTYPSRDIVPCLNALIVRELIPF
jgi:hypothetical protein